MSVPDVQVDVTVTLTMTQAQALDVMDDLLKFTGDVDKVGIAFSSDGSEAVYNALSQKLGARIL